MSTDSPDNGPSQGLAAQLGSFNRTFWVGNTMEMVERLAYYGLRTVISVYMVLSVAQAGPEFDHIQKGSIFAAWAAIQSGLPIVTGGYADRYGYKLTVAISITIKIAGYLLMAYAIDVAGILSGGASVGQPGHIATYNAFLAGAGLLAAGTAIFKPGIQGVIAHQLNDKNDSLGWSVFYQLVNVGGFLGPFLAGWMRLLDWKYVFIACAVIVAFNYLLLFAFPEPVEIKKTAGTMIEKAAGLARVFADSAMGILEPRLMGFLVIFSGFWLMFHQLFDLLPNYIEDWVDSRMVHDAILVPIFGLFGSATPVAWHGMVPQEWMINLNAGMCMTVAFLIGYLTGKVRSMTAMVAGILVAAGAIFALGLSDNGWVILLAIAAFSLGELMASPTKMRYFSSIAPPGKKGLYLGYINATNGIGWSLGSIIAGEIYQAHGDKVVLARRYLVEQAGQGHDLVAAMTKDDVVPALAAHLGTDAHGVRETLLSTYHPDSVWMGFALIGVCSMVGLALYDQITRRDLSFKVETALIALLTFTLASMSYGFLVAWLYFDMDAGTIGFGVSWATIFVLGMAVWLTERGFGRTAGRGALVGLVMVCTAVAVYLGWYKMGVALAMATPILLADLVAGSAYDWKPTAE